MGLIDVQLSWALKNGSIVFIDEVSNGLNCNCICPQCSSPLIARNKGSIRTHHFAHSTDSFCEGAPETALHIASKEIILNSKEILLPNLSSYVPFGMKIPNYLSLSINQIDNQLVKVESAISEVQVRNFRPDVKINSNIGDIYIEITVTNKPKENKIINFQKNKNLLFEIDLSDNSYNLNRKDLTKKILYDQYIRRWLFSYEEMVQVYTSVNENIIPTKKKFNKLPEKSIQLDLFQIR